MMKTIVVSGKKSGIGKTYAAEQLLRHLKNWSALKVTIARKSLCPRQNSCQICSEFKQDYDIISDNKIIKQRGSDTARLKEAGARKVVWLKATLRGLRVGLNKALTQLKNSDGVVIEGTSVLKYINPYLTIYLNDNSRYLRTAAKLARSKADIIINVSR